MILKLNIKFYIVYYVICEILCEVTLSSNVKNINMPSPTDENNEIIRPTEDIKPQEILNVKQEIGISLDTDASENSATDVGSRRRPNGFEIGDRNIQIGLSGDTENFAYSAIGLSKDDGSASDRPSPIVQLEGTSRPRDEQNVLQSGLSESVSPTSLLSHEANTSSKTEELTPIKNNSTNTKQANCIDIPPREKIGNVEVINASMLLQMLKSDTNITSRSVPSKCYLIYFFSPYCPFSTQGSAYVNALSRSLKNIEVYGLDSIEHHSANARYGVMGTPSLILFHNGNVITKYNASEYSTFHLESFIHHFTNQIIDSINVTSMDFKATLPSEVLPTSPYALYCAWLFLISCGLWLFFNSEFYAKLTETVLNNWREAEAQHAHDD